MKAKTLQPIVFLIVLLMLTGCAQMQTTRILSKDEAQVAITLNKGFENTVIAVNDGESITRCDPETKREQTSKEKESKACEPIDPDTVIYEETYKVQVRKGSVCINIWVGNHRYDFCDPPYTLTF